MPAASFRWDLEEELWLKQRVLEEYPEQSEATRPDWYRRVITDFKDRFQHAPTPTDGDTDRFVEGDDDDKWDKAPEVRSSVFPSCPFHVQANMFDFEHTRLRRECSKLTTFGSVSVRLMGHRRMIAPLTRISVRVDFRGSRSGSRTIVRRS